MPALSVLRAAKALAGDSWETISIEEKRELVDRAQGTPASPSQYASTPVPAAAHERGDGNGTAEAVSPRPQTPDRVTLASSARAVMQTPHRPPAETPPQEIPLGGVSEGAPPEPAAVPGGPGPVYSSPQPEPPRLRQFQQVIDQQKNEKLARKEQHQTKAEAARPAKTTSSGSSAGAGASAQLVPASAEKEAVGPQTPKNNRSVFRIPSSCGENTVSSLLPTPGNYEETPRLSGAPEGWSISHGYVAFTGDDINRSVLDAEARTFEQAQQARFLTISGGTPTLPLSPSYLCKICVSTNLGLNVLV